MIEQTQSILVGTFIRAALISTFVCWWLASVVFVIYLTTGIMIGA